VPDDLLTVLLPLPGVSDETFCAQQAEAIRVLAKRTTADIIEIGQRLIAAHTRLHHGDWLPWLDQEFGWSQQTASRFIAVAEAFGDKLLTVSSLNIDAGALFQLASPTTPAIAREAAIEAAEDGTRITKDEADKLIAKATRKAAEDAVAEARAGLGEEKRRAVEDATRQLANDKDALAERLADIERSMREPNVKDICETIKKTLDIKSMKPEQYKLLARILGYPISIGKTLYDPIPEVDAALVTENLRLSSQITEAIRSLFAAPNPEMMSKMTWPVQRNQHREMLDAVIGWLEDYQELLGPGVEDV
jgi:hypothetical protein